MMYQCLRPVLFLFAPERAHSIAMKLLSVTPRFLLTKVPAKPTAVMGLTFPNRVGLAAGFDKNGDYIDTLARLGFGFIEVGTVTPRPQEGNPKPRLFRLPRAQAIINRMGFNNKGVDHLVEQVKKARFNGILGINIGKNFDTPVAEAVDDYVTCFRKVYHHADYIVINISSPNTPGLRNLQHHEQLSALLKTLKDEQKSLRGRFHRDVPLVVKVAPDLEDDEIADMASIFLEHAIDGVITTNTTIDKSAVENYRYGKEQGGLSGAPLTEKANHVLAEFHKHLADNIPLIAAGGIMNAQDAKAKFAAGASLIQLYSGLIYSGPNLVKHADLS